MRRGVCVRAPCLAMSVDELAQDRTARRLSHRDLLDLRLAVKGMSKGSSDGRDDVRLTTGNDQFQMAVHRLH